MMKKIIAGLIFLGFILIVVHPFSKKKTGTSTAISPTEKITPSEKNKMVEMRKSLFVPYWNGQVDSNTVDQYDRFIYFGISANDQGINHEDPGYQHIDTFLTSTDGKTQILTLRMLDTDMNLKILDDTSLQQKIIDETLQIASEKGFEGVVVDLELSVLPFGEVKSDITSFIERFKQSADTQGLTLAMTMYGDVYYRGRAFDMPRLGNTVDEMMIMAYDFHKSRGEPGPNFPLTGRETYGYDFQKMIDDFSQDVPKEKLTVLFGMYGYDWTLGPQGKPLKAANALPLSDINRMTAPPCSLKNCKIIEHPESSETQIRYVDNEGYNHEVWYESKSSSEKKIEYLHQEGIGSVGYWVYGY